MDCRVWFLPKIKYFFVTRIEYCRNSKIYATTKYSDSWYGKDEIWYTQLAWKIYAKSDWMISNGIFPICEAISENELWKEP